MLEAIVFAQSMRVPWAGMCRGGVMEKCVLPVQAATLAWICAANVDRAVKQWAAELRRPGAKEQPGTEALQVPSAVRRRSLPVLRSPVGQTQLQALQSTCTCTPSTCYSGLSAHFGPVSLSLQHLSAADILPVLVLSSSAGVLK